MSLLTPLSSRLHVNVQIRLQTPKDTNTWECRCTLNASRAHTYLTYSWPLSTHAGSPSPQQSQLVPAPALQKTHICTNAHASISITATRCLGHLASSPWFNLFALKVSQKAADPAKRFTLHWSFMTTLAWSGLVVIWGLTLWTPCVLGNKN